MTALSAAMHVLRDSGIQLGMTVLRRGPGGADRSPQGRSCVWSFTTELGAVVCGCLGVLGLSGGCQAGSESGTKTG